MLQITPGLNLLVLETQFGLGLTTDYISLLADRLFSFTDSAVLLGIIYIIIIWRSPEKKFITTSTVLPINFVVAVLVFWSVWEVLREKIFLWLNSVAIPPREILAIVTQIYGVLHCHSITPRRLVGQEILIEMHLVVASLDSKATHQIVAEVEQKLQEKYGLVRTKIQLEPCECIEILETEDISSELTTADAEPKSEEKREKIGTRGNVC